MVPHSRREFIKGGFIATSLASFHPLFEYQKSLAQGDGDSIKVILDFAATAELLASTHYFVTLTDSNIPLTPSERRFMIATLDAEYSHLRFLNESGAQPLSTRFYAPRNVYRNLDSFTSITQQLESAFIGMYLAATRRIAELGDSRLAATMAQIAVTEGAHLALVRQLGGMLPNNVAFAEALFYEPSELAPVLRPFLEGGNDFIGPFQYPGDDTIRDFVGGEGVLSVQPFTEFVSPEDES